MIDILSLRSPRPHAGRSGQRIENNFLIRTEYFRIFKNYCYPGAALVGPPCSQCRRPKFNHWSRNYIPYPATKHLPATTKWSLRGAREIKDHMCMIKTQCSQIIKIINIKKKLCFPINATWVQILAQWCNPPIQQMSPFPAVIVEELRMKEAAICHVCHCLRWTRRQDLAPESWGAHEKNEFSERRGLHLPIHTKLNLTWYLTFLTSQ